MTFSTLKRFFKAFRRYRLHIAILIVLGFLGGILEGVGISAIIPLFALLAGEGTGELNAISKIIVGAFDYFPFPYSAESLLIMVVVFFALRAVVMVTFNYLRARVGASFMVRTMNEVLEKVLRAEWGYLLKQRLGYAETIFLRDIRQASALLESVSQAVLVFTNLIIYVVLAFYISAPITLITTVAGAVLLLFLQPVRTMTRKIADVASTAEKGMAHFISEHVLGVKTVKATGTEYAVFKKGTGFFDTLKRVLIRSSFVQSAGSAVVQPLALIFIASVFLYFHNVNAANLGAFLVLVYLIQKIFVYVEAGQSTLHAVYEKLPYATALLSFRDDLVAHQEKSSGTEPFSFSSDLSFKNVGFAYESGAAVLTNVDFTVRKGEMVGLIGPSGAGKTSVADLILRFFTATNGSVELDGVPVGQFNLSEWRHKVGYVSQDQFLLSDTVKNNIRFYDDSVSDEAIERALKMAHCKEFIDKLPEGIDTLVGERGVRLSAGQRQRIMLARVLAREPAMLILDEATSALDNESEKHVQQAIDDLRGKVTMFIIAHRLSTVTHVDNILVLKDGKIAESGSPEKLLADTNSYFYKMHHIKGGADLLT